MFAVSPRQPAKETLYVESQTARRDSIRSGESCPVCGRARDPPVVYILVCWKTTRDCCRSQVGKATFRWVFCSFSRRCFLGLNDVGSEGISEHEGNDSIDLAARR